MSKFIGPDSANAVKVPCTAPTTSDVLKVDPANPTTGTWGKVDDPNVTATRSMVRSDVVDGSKNLDFNAGTGWVNKSLDNLADGSTFKKVTGVDGTSHQVTTTSIANGAISSAHFSAGAVDAVALGSGAVTSAKLSAGAVDASALAAGAVTNSKIAAGAVDATSLASAAVTSAKLASGAVDSTALAASAVTTAKIASGAVDSAALGSSAVTTAKLAAGAVTTTELADTAVSTAKLADSAVSSAKVASAAITGAKVASNTLDGSHLTSGPLTISSSQVTFSGPVTAQQSVALVPPASDGCPYAIVAAPATTNYIKNPSFEVNVTDDWTLTGTGATVTRETGAGNFYWGTASAKLVAGSFVVGAITSTTHVTASAGEVWTASLWIKSSSPPSGASGLNFYNSSNQFIGGAVGTPASTNWERLVMTATAPAGTSYARVEIDVDVNQTAYIDGVQLEKLAGASPYCDGSLGGGYAWSGTAHNSTSARTSGLTVPGPLNDAVPSIVLWDEGRVDVMGAAFRGGGSSFPASPIPNDLFFRTDLASLFVYSGSNWLALTPGIITFSAYNPSTQTPATDTDTLINVTSEDFDYGSNYDTTNKKFVAPVGGVYFFSLEAEHTAPVATQYLTVGLGINTSTAISVTLGRIIEAGTTAGHRATGGKLVKLSSGDSVYPMVRENGAVGARTINSGMRFCGNLVRAL